MSSAEAEYYAMVEGAARTLGLQSMLREVGVEVKIVLQTDSAAAKSYASQRGLGRMRHIEVKDLWLQEATCRGRLKLRKVEGRNNPADICPKFLSRKELEDGCARLNVEVSTVTKARSKM